MKRLSLPIVGLAFLGLVGCSGLGTPLSPAQNEAAGIDATRIEAEAGAINTGCGRVLALANSPLLDLAGSVPGIGAVAAGVKIGCGTAAGLSRLVAAPGTAEWLGRQEEILKQFIRSRNQS